VKKILLEKLCKWIKKLTSCPACNFDSSNSDGYRKDLTDTDKWFQFCLTSANKVLPLLNCLNKLKAAGLDNTSARLIRECVDLICIPISDTFNQSTNQGTFLDGWRCRKLPHFLNKEIYLPIQTVILCLGALRSRYKHS